MLLKIKLAAEEISKSRNPKISHPFRFDFLPAETLIISGSL
jgi:hypothetical protein